MANILYAGFGIRFVAMLLDGIIIGIPIFLLTLFFKTLLGIDAFSYILQLAAIIFTIYMDGMKGGTPGKLILKLKIVNDQGKLIGIPAAILRYIGKFVSMLTFGIGFLMILWTKKKQGLHDKIAGTFVVRR